MKSFYELPNGLYTDVHYDEESLEIEQRTDFPDDADRVDYARINASIDGSFSKIDLSLIKVSKKSVRIFDNTLLLSKSTAEMLALRIAPWLNNLQNDGGVR